MALWEKQLEKYNATLEYLKQSHNKQRNKLRFNRSVIIASDIASQYYCEKKVEMQYLIGEVKTEEKTIGSQSS